MIASEKIDWRKQFVGLMFISPWLIGVSVFVLLPVILSFYYSFCDYTLFQNPMFIGTKNYSEMIHDDLFWKTLGNTFYAAALSLPASLLMSLAFAVLLNVKTIGQNFYRTIIFLPCLIPAIASAMLWMYILEADRGLINSTLRTIMAYLPEFMRFSPPAWLLNPHWVLPAMAFMGLWGIGQTMTIYLAALQDVPRELYEAAELDGAGPIRRLFHVTLPMISPVIFFNLIMGIIGSLQNFTGPFIMTGRGVADSTYMYTMYLYDNAFVNLRMGYASGMAWIQLLIILFLTFIAFWTAQRWVHYQGK